MISGIRSFTDLKPRYFHTRHALGAPPASTVYVSPTLRGNDPPLPVVEQSISS
jgi:hypothetical protein